MGLLLCGSIDPQESGDAEDALLHVTPEVIDKLVAAGFHTQLCIGLCGTSDKATSSSGPASSGAITVDSEVLNAFYAAELATFTKVPGADPDEGCSLPSYMLRAARKARGNRFAPVTLHVYDTFWLTKQAGLPTFHTGVEVLGTEFAYGDMGICCCRPGEYDAQRYRKAVHLGRTDLRDQEVLLVLRELQQEWPGEAYSLNGHNCQTFAATFCDRLGLERSCIPSEFLMFAEPWLVPPWEVAAILRNQSSKRLDQPRLELTPRQAASPMCTIGPGSNSAKRSKKASL